MLSFRRKFECRVDVVFLFLILVSSSPVSEVRRCAGSSGFGGESDFWCFQDIFACIGGAIMAIISAIAGCIECIVASTFSISLSISMKLAHWDDNLFSYC